MTLLIPIRDHNPYRHFPIVTIVLIGANVFAYFATTSSIFFGPDEVAVFTYGAVPCDVMGRCPTFSERLSTELAGRPGGFTTVLTSMFMHGGLLHIGGNMLFLWVFGNNVEDRMGRIRFVVFYFLTGLVAAYAHILLNAASPVPVVGASGAVSGVLGAYIVLFPHARVVSLVPLGFFFFTVEVPAWLLLGLWFLLQVFGGLANVGADPGGGVAFLAHIGGFAAGWLLVRIFADTRRRRTVPGWLDD